jgi:S1-C subfamily serine protease
VAATVRVSDAATASVGSGVVIGVRGGFAYVLTAAHVLGPDAKAQVETLTPSGTAAAGSRYDSCELVFRAPESDVAVVRLPAGKRNWATVRLAAPSGGAAGPDAVWSVGCDDGKEATIEAVALTERKLVKRKDGTGAFFWAARGEAVRGRSGGPLLDAEGRLLGICSGTQEGISYYVHLGEIRNALEDHFLRWVFAEVKK